MKKKGLPRILIVLLFSIVYFPSFAAWLNFEPQTIVQPNGQVINCFGTGDEFYNWLHDKDGFTIIQDKETGYYSYAVLLGDQLLPSEYIVGQTDPSSKGLLPWTNISGKQMATIRAKFLKTQMPSKEHLQGFKEPGAIKSEGTMNNVVVYIRFSDQSEFTQDTMFYSNMFNNTSSGYNSMINYFQSVSFQQLTLPSWFYPTPSGSTVISYQDIYERSYFMPYNGTTNPNGYQPSQRGAREHALLKRAINYIEDEVPADLDLDFDNDGYVDNVVFNVRGATTAWSTLLWPHRWVLSNEVVYIHGKRVWDYNFQLENSLNSSGNGVLCHEMFHSLGAPDLYHYSSAPYVSVGSWDVMDNNANPPQSMGAYMKYKYGGWIDNIPEITECGTYTLNPVSNEENNVYKIASPNSYEYFVVEYRVKEGTFENSIQGTGLLVYRINPQENGNAQGPPDEVYLYRPGGTNFVNGNLGNAHFGADYDRTEINDNTDPSSFLTNNQDGGLNISNVGFVGETISFDVTFDKEPVAEFKANEEQLTEGCGIDFEDLSLCDVNSWLWTFEGGSPSTSTEQNPQGIVYQNAGNYDVTLKVTNAFGQNTIVKPGFIEVSGSLTPEVMFFASDSAVCTGAEVQFLDYSKVCPDSWNWEISPSSYEFVNGTSASSQNPELQFNVAGSYSVSLTVTNANGSTTLNKDDYIFAGGLVFPFTEDFEGGNAEENGWTIVNLDNDDITWEMYSVSGNGGNKAAGINLFSYFSIFKRDQLISPPIDLSGTNTALLKFDHAYALATNPNYSDSLIVKISGDCGNTWTPVMQLGDDGNGSFATHPASEFEFVPASTEDWCGTGYGSVCLEADITQWAGQSNVMIMFETVRLVGNNMFIDNVSVGLITGNPESVVENDHTFNIFPNPSTGKLKVSLNNTGTNGRISVFNANGQLVLSESFGNNNTTKTVDLSAQPKGLYFINFISDSFQESRKIILE